MKKLFIILTILLVLISCSGSTETGSDQVENGILSAMNEAIEQRTPVFDSDGNRVFNLSDFEAGNGVVITGKIVVDGEGNIISVELKEFSANGVSGKYTAEAGSDGELVSNISTVKSLRILLARGEKVSSEFDPSEYIVEVTYSDGSIKNLGGNGLVISFQEKDPETGEYSFTGEVEATYGGLTVREKFEIEEPTYIIPVTKEVTHIDIYPVDDIKEGDTFSPSLFHIKVTYSDGATMMLNGSSDIIRMENENDTIINNGDIIIAKISGYTAQYTVRTIADTY